MLPIVAQVVTFDLPVFWAIVAGFVGLVGVVAAFVAKSLISKDESAIRTAQEMLVSSESWQGAHASSEHDLSEWLASRSIQPESGVADVIRACWSAWLGGRSTSLTELHVLVARRERSKMAARLSAGIATLLLVIGIVGTLASVKPVLKAFRFQVSVPDGVTSAEDSSGIVNVADSTELVNSLMHNLGDAFLPSLVALFATIIVVFARGFYTIALHRYTLQLDRFAMGSVMPHYRPRSISQEYEEVRGAFAALAGKIGERQEKFDRAVEQLTAFVDGLGPTLVGLEGGIVKMTDATDTLATKSNSIGATLSRTLGKNSPLYAAVSGFEGIFASANEKLDQLSRHIDAIHTEQQKDRAAMIRSLDEVEQIITKVSADHEVDRNSIARHIDAIKASVEILPASLLDSALSTFNDGMKQMRVAVNEFNDKQSEESSAFHQAAASKIQDVLNAMSTALTSTADRIANSVNAVPAVVERLNDSLDRTSATEKAAANAIASLAAQSNAEMRRVADEVVRNIPSVSYRMSPPTVGAESATDGRDPVSTSDGEDGRLSPAEEQQAVIADAQPTPSLTVSSENQSSGQTEHPVSEEVFLSSIGSKPISIDPAGADNRYADELPQAAEDDGAHAHGGPKNSFFGNIFGAKRP